MIGDQSALRIDRLRQIERAKIFRHIPASAETRVAFAA